MIRHNSLSPIIGRHVADVLAQRGTTKQGTARNSGFAPTTFRRCLTGHREFSVGELWRVAQALGISVSELFPPDSVVQAEQDRIRAEEEAMWDEIDYNGIAE